MFTELGPGPGGSILAREDATGETIPILPANAAAMRQAGTLSSGRAPSAPQPRQPMPGALSAADTANITNFAKQQTAIAPVTNALSQLSAAKPTQPSGPNPTSMDAIPDGFATPQPQSRNPNLQPVRRPQGQPGGQQLPGVEYEMVRTPGRKAGYVPNSRTTAGISEGQQNELLAENSDITAMRDEGLQASYDEQRSILEARKASAAEEAANKRIDADLAQMRANDIIARNKKVETELNNEWAALTATKVDRDRVWKDKGWGAGILSAIAVSLGEFGSKLSGGQNGAMMMIERMIDRDIEAQQQDLQTRRDGLTRKQANYDNNLRNEAVPDIEEARLLRWESAQKQLAEEAANEDLAMLRPKLLEASAMAGERAMALKSEILNARKIQETEAYDRGSPGGMTIRETARSQMEGRRLKENASRAKDMGEIQKVTGGGMSETAIVSPNGEVLGNAPNAARAEKLNERQASFAEAERLGTQMLDIIKAQEESGSMFRSEEDKARYSSLATRYKNALWSAVRSDAPSADESAQFEEAMGGVSLANFRTGRQASVLQQTLEDGRGNLADRIQQQGGNPSYLRTRKPNPKNEGYTP